MSPLAEALNLIKLEDMDHRNRQVNNNVGVNFFLFSSQTSLLSFLFFFFLFHSQCLLEGCLSQEEDSSLYLLYLIYINRNESIILFSQHESTL